MGFFNWIKLTVWYRCVIDEFNDLGCSWQFHSISLHSEKQKVLKIESKSFLKAINLTKRY